LVRLCSAAVAALLIGALLTGADRAHAAALPWRVGAARSDITPPPFDATADAAAFPACPASAFAGHRDFALQEPYVDDDGDGHFSYPEPYCDANANGRYDGMYLSSAVDHIARRVHDPIDARAIAVSDGARTIVLESVTSQGLFETYSHRIRDRARQLRPAITDLIVSSNHNESSPDPIGIYGAPAPDPSPVGLRSSVDDYYMAFLVERAAQAAAAAVDAMRPATIAATSFPIPPGLQVHLSKNFPTTNDDGSPAAIDPEIRVLAATGADGRRIVTLMNLSAHNQQIGHTGATSYDVSADWPGYFHRDLERRVGGMGMFLVGVNGSEEDPATVPPLTCSGECYRQAQATGEALAAAVAAHVADAKPIAAGAVAIQRDEFFVPLENNLFAAAAAAGLFGPRVGYIGGVAVGPGLGTDFRTEVGTVDIGPDVQMLANPGESFPALILGSPWGIEDAGCPERPNPPVPAFHARATWRFQIGLADDLIGYLIPAWGFSTMAGVYTTACFNDSDDKDPRGHQHKLETESVGPTAGNLVAQHLTALLDRSHPSGHVSQGRFIRPDGSLSRRADGAVGVALADKTVIATGAIASFGDRAPERHGRFIDYNGATQAAPDIRTRGMLADNGDSIYLDVYPALTLAALGPARMAATVKGVKEVLPVTGGSSPLTALAVLAVALLTRRRQIGST
jgi:hypothetical protein